MEAAIKATESKLTEREHIRKDKVHNLYCNYVLVLDMLIAQE